MPVSLETAKKHLRVVEYDAAGAVLPSDEDEEIQLYLDAAVRWTLSYTRRDEIPEGAEFEFDAAALLMMAGMYENREAVITGTIQAEIPTARRLIDPYRRMSV